jgi:hypothetical protein
LWLYDHGHHEIISPALLDILHEAETQDITRLTARNTPSKQRTSIRAAIRDALTAMTGDSSTHPISLSELSFELVSGFLDTFQKPFHHADVNGQDAVVPGVDPLDPSQTTWVQLGKSVYDGITSSLACLFTECKVARDVSASVKEMWLTIPQYKKGSARTGARQRQQLGLRQNEGRDPFPFAAYNFLANILSASPDPEHVHAHLFLLLDWNLMSRADTVIQQNIELIGIRSDALVFEIGPTKTDQEAKKNRDHPFHIYSVPENPAICTVTAMAKQHLVTRPHVLNGRHKLFEGAGQYEHYNNILRKIVQSDEYRQSFIDRGLNPNYFGTHSLRKGAVTHTASGITSSPPIASICICASWSMPGVMNRYIKHESAGDQYVGRSVSGRNRMSTRFAESLPYFDLSDVDGVEREAMLCTVNNWIKARMPAGGAINEAVFCLFKSCLASLVFHRRWLEQNLHSENPVFATSFFSEMDSMPFADRVTTRYPWNATKDTPAFTGVPPDILLMAKIEQLELTIERLESRQTEESDRIIDTVTARINNSLDERAVGGDGYGLTKEDIGKLDLLIEQSKKAFEERLANVARPNHDADNDNALFALVEEFDDGANAAVE